MRNASSKLAMRAASSVSASRPFAVQLVELSQGIELPALGFEVLARAGKVLDRLGEVRDERALVRGRQEAVAPERRALRRLRRADDDEARQVAVLGAEAVEQPRPHRRPRERLLAGVHLQARAVVVDVVGDHSAEHAQVVGVLRQVREQFADLDPALAVLGELERRRQAVDGLACERASAARTAAACRRTP